MKDCQFGVSPVNYSDSDSDSEQDQASKQPLQDSPLDQFPSTRDSSLTSSEYDSELDSDGEYIHDQEFCANCLRQSPECTLKRCTHCLLRVGIVRVGKSTS